MVIGKSVVNETRGGVSSDLRGQFFTGSTFSSDLYTFVFFELRNPMDIIIDAVRFNRW